MITKRKISQSEAIMMTLEDIVPEGSIYRKIEKSIEFAFIYEEVKGLYSENEGRPSIDPIVLFKLVFIQYLDGIKSMRKTCEKIKTDAEYRWFLDIPFGQDTPHYSTFSKNYERRFKENDIFEKIFINIVKQADRYGLVGKEDVYTDSTHKKANANIRKSESQIVNEIKKRRKDIEEEINQERLRLGKKEFVYVDEKVEKKIKVSKTDSGSGYYHRSKKEQGFMYIDHRTVDGKENIIIDSHVTKGNVHDSVPFIERMKHIETSYGWKPKSCGLDSGYDNLEIKRYFEDNNIFGVIAQRRYGQGGTKIRKWQFTYNPERDVYKCPRTGIVLEYHNISKDGYKEYYSSQGCKGCLHLKECCGKNKYRKIRRYIKEEINERARSRRLSPKGKDIAQKRRQTIERSFADSKCNHGFRYAMYKGVKKNQNYTWLSCAAQNMKNIAIKVDRKRNKQRNSSESPCFYHYLFEFPKILEIFKLINPLAFSN